MASSVARFEVIASYMDGEQTFHHADAIAIDGWEISQASVLHAALLCIPPQQRLSLVKLSLCLLLDGDECPGWLSWQPPNVRAANKLDNGKVWFFQHIIGGGKDWEGETAEFFSHKSVPVSADVVLADSPGKFKTVSVEAPLIFSEPPVIGMEDLEISEPALLFLLLNELTPEDRAQLLSLAIRVSPGMWWTAPWALCSDNTLEGGRLIFTPQSTAREVA